MLFLHCLFGLVLIGEASNGLLRVLEESKFVPVSYPPSLPSLPQALPLSLLCALGAVEPLTRVVPGITAENVGLGGGGEQNPWAKS